MADLNSNKTSTCIRGNIYRSSLENVFMEFVIIFHCTWYQHHLAHIHQHLRWHPSPLHTLTPPTTLPPSLTHHDTHHPHTFPLFRFFLTPPIEGVVGGIPFLPGGGGESSSLSSKSERSSRFLIWACLARLRSTGLEKDKHKICNY